MDNFLDRYVKAATSMDRVYTGFTDINGKNINVGDVLITKNGKTHFCINYSQDRNIYYGVGEGNKILNQKDFHRYENYGVAILKSVFN